MNVVTRPFPKIALLVALVLALVLVLALSVQAFSQKAEPAKESPTKSALKAPSWILYCVEFRDPCGPPVMPSFLGERLKSAFLKEGMKVRSMGATPLISREDLKYSMVAAQGETELRTGRIYAEVGPGSQLNFRTPEGKGVVLQVDVNEVCWDINTEAALTKSKEAGACCVVLARFQVEDLTADVNPSGYLGKQKSVRVNLDVVEIRVADGETIGVFSEDTRQMDVSRDGAASKASKVLAKKAAQYFKEAHKNSQ